MAESTRNLKRIALDHTHPLTLNLQKVASCLKGILLPTEIEKITAELRRNVRQAIRLSEGHLRSARKASAYGSGSWRHVVSRAYYCCYCASRAVRLAKTGVFSMESDDHKKIGALPDTFPSLNIWADVLTKFRADRNLADYDHSVRENKLEYSAVEYVAKADAFLKQVKQYLKAERVL